MLASSPARAYQIFSEATDGALGGSVQLHGTGHGLDARRRARTDAVSDRVVVGRLEEWRIRPLPSLVATPPA